MSIVSACTPIFQSIVSTRFWKAQEHGLYTQQWWHKRKMLNDHALFRQTSIPASGVNDYCRNVDKAVPRRMEACAICAVKDWIEQRVQIYLFAKPNGRTSRFFNVSSQQVHGESEGIHGYETEESNNNSGEQPPAASGSYYKKDDCLCIGEPDKVEQNPWSSALHCCMAQDTNRRTPFFECTTPTSSQYAQAFTFTQGAQR